jgi:hypothetical protein
VAAPPANARPTISEAKRRGRRHGGRPQGQFKIKERSQKIKNTSSNSIKPNQGFFDEKNSEFFSGHFDGKTLENQAKTTKKTFKIGQKTRDF